MEVGVPADQVKAGPPKIGALHGIVGAHVDNAAQAVAVIGARAVFDDFHLIGEVGVEGRDQSEKVPRLVHSDAIPKQQVLVVGPAPNVDV